MKAQSYWITPKLYSKKNLFGYCSLMHEVQMSNTALPKHNLNRHNVFQILQTSIRKNMRSLHTVLPILQRQQTEHCKVILLLQTLFLIVLPAWSLLHCALVPSQVQKWDSPERQHLHLETSQDHIVLEQLQRLHHTVKQHLGLLGRKIQEELPQ